WVGEWRASPPPGPCGSAPPPQPRRCPYPPDAPPSDHNPPLPPRLVVVPQVQLREVLFGESAPLRKLHLPHTLALPIRIPSLDQQPGLCALRVAPSIRLVADISLSQSHNRRAHLQLRTVREPVQGGLRLIGVGHVDPIEECADA